VGLFALKLSKVFIKTNYFLNASNNLSNASNELLNLVVTQNGHSIQTKRMFFSSSYLSNNVFVNVSDL